MTIVEDVVSECHTFDMVNWCLVTPALTLIRSNLSNCSLLYSKTVVTCPSPAHISPPRLPSPTPSTLWSSFVELPPLPYNNGHDLTLKHHSERFTENH